MELAVCVPNKATKENNKIFYKTTIKIVRRKRKYANETRKKEEIRVRFENEKEEEDKSERKNAYCRSIKITISNETTENAKKPQLSKIGNDVLVSRARERCTLADRSTNKMYCV